MTSFRRAVAYAAPWLLVALGFAFSLSRTQGLSLRNALVAGFSTALPAALLGLAVLALCDRVPLRRTSWARLMAVHGPAAVAYSALWTGAIVLQMLLVPAAARATFLRDGMPWQLMTGVVVYAVIAGVAYARASRQREEEQARAAERAETLRLRAELGALRARLAPHFLFNVLQTIGTLVDDRPAQVHVALEHLAALLRRRLGAADEALDVVPLAEELADMRDYLALEGLRHGDRLQVAVDVDDEVMDFLLPRFTLQPLVENAVHHGLAPRAAGGRLAIGARRDGEGWTLTIADDGMGSDPARFAAGTGIGVSVVRERLRLRFGERAALAVTTAPGAGCRVELRLPGVTDDTVLVPVRSPATLGSAIVTTRTAR